jgi:hypothetical protein
MKGVMKKRLIFFALIALLVAGCGSNSFLQINTPAPNAQTGTPAPGGQIDVPGVSIQVYAPGPNQLGNLPDARGRVAGILLGIWHGIISPVTLVISFFNPGVQMYEVHNDGNQYNLGFLIGVALVFILLGALLGSGRR